MRKMYDKLSQRPGHTYNYVKDLPGMDWESGEHVTLVPVVGLIRFVHQVLGILIVDELTTSEVMKYEERVLSKIRDNLKL